MRVYAAAREGPKVFLEEFVEVEALQYPSTAILLLFVSEFTPRVWGYLASLELRDCFSKSAFMFFMQFTNKLF